MALALVTVGFAVVVSVLRGHQVRRLFDSDLRSNWLLFAGVALQVLVGLAAGAGWIDGGGSYVGIATSQLAVLLWVLRNRARPGMALIGLGLLLNAVVMAANGAMPVDPQAVPSDRTIDLPDGKHELLTSDTRLPWLADIIPVAPIRTVVSIGDIALAAGLVPLVHHLMGSRTERAARSA